MSGISGVEADTDDDEASESDVEIDEEIQATGRKPPVADLLNLSMERMAIEDGMSQPQLVFYNFIKVLKKRASL